MSANLDNEAPQGADRLLAGVAEVEGWLNGIVVKPSDDPLLRREHAKTARTLAKTRDCISALVRQSKKFS